MRPERARSVVLLSGGLDSSANLAFCAASDLPVLALTADYGQQAAPRELEAAQSLCRYYGIRHATVDLKWLGKLGGSALTEEAIGLPTLAPSELDDTKVTRESARSVWVPNRNGVLINVAGAFAERLGATRIVVGFNAEEAATFPDNTMDFLARATEALRFSTSNQAAVHCYTGQWDKTRIVAELRRLEKPFPFERIWSCYRGGPKPCGSCESCGRLARALGKGARE